MNRIEIQLTEEQDCRLNELGAARGVTKADLVREAVDQLLRSAAAVPNPGEGRVPQIAGRFHSGRRDTSALHDDYVTE